MIRTLRLLFSSVACFALAAAPALPASAPAMWLVQGKNAKVYLFGTIHVMKPNVTWTTPAIDQALASSDDLWLEVPEPLDNPAALVPELKTLGTDPEHPLSTKISKADLALLDEKIKAAGLPGEAAIDALRPWLAGLMISVLPSMKAGYSGSSGIDVSLRSKMTAAGKPIKGFETIEQQLHLFADLSEPQQLAFLHESLQSDDGKDAPTIDKLETLWQSGNAAETARLEASMIAADPALSDVLITRRNADWAKQLDARLKGTGTSFVAVGLLHLVGEGSLIDNLTKLGYTVTRVE